MPKDRGRVWFNAGEEGGARGKARADGGGGEKAGNQDRTQGGGRGWSQRRNVLIPVAVAEEK